METQIEVPDGLSTENWLTIGWRTYLLEDSYSILTGWKNNFSTLFNVNGISDVRQNETHTSEQAVRNGRAFEVSTTFQNV